MNESLLYMKTASFFTFRSCAVNYRIGNFQIVLSSFPALGTIVLDVLFKIAEAGTACICCTMAHCSLHVRELHCSIGNGTAVSNDNTRGIVLAEATLQANLLAVLPTSYPRILFLSSGLALVIYNVP